MPRLSIVIPGLSFDSLVEDTLVSVLQHRPEYSEVIVACSTPYDDPYGLGREVKFLVCRQARELIELMNAGCLEARGDVVHVLLPGTLATDGWTDHVWEHFAQSQVGAVSPLSLSAAEATKVQAAGVTYLAHGERRLVGAGSPASSVKLGAAKVLGPVLSAGFYRRDVLVALGGFDPAFGLPLADVEMGLALQDLGYHTVVDLQSQVVVESWLPSRPRNQSEARCSELLFRRQSDASEHRSWKRTILTGWEFVTQLPRWRAVQCLSGRWAARREESPRAAYEQRLEEARSTLSGHGDADTTVSTIALSSAADRTSGQQRGPLCEVRRAA